MLRTSGPIPQYWMDTVSAAPASASGTADHEDVHRACEEENAYTGTDEGNFMDQFIDEIDPQFESDMEEFVDTDTDEDDSMDQLIEDIERMDQRLGETIDEINFLNQHIEEVLFMNQLDDETDHIQQIMREMDSPFESDMEESVDPATDEDDSTGELDDAMFSALSQVSSSLCRDCRAFGQGIWEIKETGYTSEYTTHHLCLSSLQRSVDEGCRLCMAVAQSLEDFCQRSNPPAAQKEFWTIKARIGRVRRAFTLSFFLCQCERDHDTFDICEDASLIHEATFCPARKLGLGPEFLGMSNDRCHSSSTASANLSGVDPTLRKSSAKSATSFAVARSWYQQCLNHATCRNWSQESRVLPTRLVQIWKTDQQSTDLSAKICETKDLPTSTPYVTLSHCWGKGVIFKLLQNNLQELSQAIPIGKLPKVFQDAIQVSYELAISYIWIDSLCIIQDSKEDWTYEAKRMGSVYANGEFNIAATGYEDGLSGLFGERKAFSFVHIPMRMQCELVNERYETQDVFEGIYVTVRSDEFRHNVIFSPLNDRAWVAQERVLSPAIIHYTPEKIYWECCQGVASEAFMNGSDIWEVYESEGRQRIRSLSTQSEREEIYSFWRNFLSQYANMEMSFHRDRFPAAAGIARILGELIDDNLVAGFWEGDLLQSLLMDRMVLRRRNILPEQLAPSWSWMSIYAGLMHPTQEVLPGQDKSQLEPLNGVDFKVLSDIPGFKSDLHSPSLEKSGVRGLAIKGALRKLSDDFDKQFEWLDHVDMNYDNEHPVKFHGDAIPQEQAWRFNNPTHMLLLAREAHAILNYDTVHGLLVQFAEGAEANAFRRSGSIQLYFLPSEQYEKCDEYLGLREQDGEYEPSLFFEEKGLQDVILL